LIRLVAFTHWLRINRLGKSGGNTRGWRLLFGLGMLVSSLGYSIEMRRIGSSSGFGSPFSLLPGVIFPLPGCFLFFPFLFPFDGGHDHSTPDWRPIG
jgi:drug/metabolite transporter (DMT)-like permease